MVTDALKGESSFPPSCCKRRFSHQMVKSSLRSTADWQVSLLGHSHIYTLRHRHPNGVSRSTNRSGASLVQRSNSTATELLVRNSSTPIASKPALAPVPNALPRHVQSVDRESILEAARKMPSLWSWRSLQARKDGNHARAARQWCKSTSLPPAS